MALNHNQNHSYKLVSQPPSPIKAQPNTIHHPPQPASTLPIVAIIAPIIFVTSLIFIFYLTLMTKSYCSNWHHVNPLRWVSNILRPERHEDQDPSITFSPMMWNQGLDESIIREIPTFQFTKGEGNLSVYGCVVCLTEFQEEDMLKVLPNCSHPFHLDCIDIWLQNNAICPICRSSISGNSTSCPLDHIIAPSSSPQDSQLVSNMGSDEDFVVIELGEEHEGTVTLPQMMQQETSEPREIIGESRSHCTRKTMHLKSRKFHHVSIMGDECIDVGKKDEQFCIQPIRRSFSMDSAIDRQVYLDVQTIIQHNNRHQNEASGSEDCSSRARRSFFPFRYGRGSKTAVLPLENED
ncbi:hypothetical protein VNO77_17405 [Canavalia gladiata]|uniref:RING-type E3 ubiquitin transferase n=1 Tax=Canavalia gladiata TaxID=3824 RepID=A0AAN9LIX3_CANGL